MLGAGLSAGVFAKFRCPRRRALKVFSEAHLLRPSRCSCLMVATAVDQTLEYSISAAEKDEVIRSLDDVIDEQDGRAYNVRPCIAAPSASPAFKDPDKAPIDLSKLALPLGACRRKLLERKRSFKETGHVR